MIMTHGEIVQSYKEAKEKTTQISLLAQLNDCPRSEIKAILESAGALDELDAPRKIGRPKGSKNVPKEKPFVIESPAVFDEKLHARALEAYRETLQVRKTELEKEYQEKIRVIDEEMALIERDISRRSDVETA